MSKSTPRLTILVAGTPDEFRENLLATLIGWGYTVFATDTLASAEELFLSHKPNVVFVQWRFGEGDSLHFCHLVRETHFDRSCFLALLWAEPVSVSPSDEVLGLMDDILSPTWKTFELLARIRTWERVIHMEGAVKDFVCQLEEAERKIHLAEDQKKKNLMAVAKIQTTLLPTNLPDLEKVEFAWAYKPLTETAGDALNVFRLDEYHVAFYILDVAGREPSAAFLSVSLHRILTPFPLQSGLLKELADQPPGYRLVPPEEVLYRLNQDFRLDLETKEYFTILYGIIDLKTSVFHFATAGHPLPLIRQADGRLVSAEGGGFPIGFVDDASFQPNQITLKPGDRMFLFSDGLSEALSPERKMFGKIDLPKAILDGGNLPLQSCVDKIMAAGEAWCGSTGYGDDVSLLGLEMK